MIQLLTVSSSRWRTTVIMVMKITMMSMARKQECSRVMVLMALPSTRMVSWRMILMKMLDIDAMVDAVDTVVARPIATHTRLTRGV